jgi:hypothetical protein
MMEAAKEQMLEGQEPSSRMDWIKVINFWAVNIHPSAAVAAIHLMKMIFKVPLTDSEVEEITLKQLSMKS